ncbi:hypothetical protein [Gloeobacter kilaueensis]|uniref:Uncharacterized protein n=1 Tax=Gloeobacter kilaueensis (strain ATCC BAA-2537 / CCAP 1431/1 / ULC 316 / JS1) TaxID=1183438 RepID=U5QDW4_GLOK1|nr:hypothetical protein [Gloeobacter kilaueensis]AGY57152.1 hypothetical protein GKIL_0906 [Gloeobacter kilaueensis JS1]
MNNDLEILQPEGQAVETGSTAVTVSALAFGNLRKALQLWQGYLAVLDTAGLEPADLALQLAGLAEPDTILAFCELCLSAEDYEKLQAGSAMDVFAVFASAVEVNADFFTQTAPGMARLLAKTLAVGGPGGARPSPA